MPKECCCQVDHYGVLSPNPFSDRRVCVRCTKCGARIQSGGESFQALVGHILKLRCLTCSFEDWYLESEFFIPEYYVSSFSSEARDSG